MNHIRFVEKNTKGRDFFVTDVHGYFDLLVEKMREVGFSPANGDRLFSSGDWCDRGPQSNEVLDWLQEPWVYSTRANHEQLLIQSFEDGFVGPAARCLYENGGDWVFELIDAEKLQTVKAIYEAFKSIPLAIELESRSGRKVGIVHAEVPYEDWEQFKNITKAELEWNGEAIAQWARTKYDKRDESLIKNIDRVLVGHTPTESGNVEVLGNVWYSDAGSFFRNKLNFFEVE